MFSQLAPSPIFMYVVTNVSYCLHSVLHVLQTYVSLENQQPSTSVQDQYIHLDHHGNLESHIHSYIFFSEIFIIFVSSKIDAYYIICDR